MTRRRRQKRSRRLEQLCRDHGLSVTVQRRAIFEAMADRADHPTADQIHDEVKEHIPDVSRTTVYRVLETLVDIGAITKACSPGAATRFDPKTNRHHHLVCLRCEKLIDLDDKQLHHHVELPDVRSQSFEVTGLSIHFHGICAACRKERRQKNVAAPGTGKPMPGKPKNRARTSQNKKRRTRP
jgi:Fur family peroxide stress response transcriptional regulator